MSALTPFHPHIRRWFEAAFAAPTDVQSRSWPRIASGEHVLITAPTGSGKTLTAFLWAINAFATGASESGATRVLYISPLKALNNDIRANLVEPIGALRERFAAAGETFPSLRVQVRSGDTEQSERQRMLRRPPELLITTPESLNLLLTTVRGRLALSTVETVILDEIHSVVENRRGVTLMAALERLVEVAGEFQRVALSATVRPLETVAEYVGGRDAEYQPRPVGIVESPAAKAIDLRIRFPEAAQDAADRGEKVWVPMADAFKEIIDANQATLFFANSRRMAEKITLRLNDEDALHSARPTPAHPGPLAYAHHGSLSREIRSEVEQRLKRGELKAIVATSSLEMGIDIGHLDEVVLIQSPPSIAAALQRIGRAGHRVGEVSRGSLFPSYAQDFVTAAVLAKAVQERDIEPLRPLANPLDVLAQILVSCAATEEWQTDALYSVIRRATPYATLPREQFDLVVEMLAGRYAGTRVRDLRPRLAYDRVAQTVVARKGAALALYASGGTIPDRGYFTLRHADTGAAIGELDEEFVWESSVGATFTLGTQNWRVERITPSDVLVRLAPPNAGGAPFWRAESYRRGAYYSQRIAEFLTEANALLKTKRRDALAAELARRGFDEVAADELVGFLERQREATECDLPHAEHVLVEHVLAGPGGFQGPDRQQQIVLHTLWGGAVNQPIALALEAAWNDRFGGVAEMHADNDTIVVQVKEEVDPALVLSLVTPANFEPLLRRSLEDSAFFGARFRECAGRALLLTKRRFNQRMPLWMTRLQAKKLMTATKPLTDFPVMLETWRTSLRDEFDLPAAFSVLERLASGEIGWSLATVSVPSPFAANVAFQQINRYMYADDAPEQTGRSALSDDLIRQAVFDQSLRPAISAEVILDFESRAQRRRAGYAPEGDVELGEWVKERVAIPLAEWFEETPVPPGVERRSVAGREFLVHREVALGEDPVREAGEMLQFYGPRTPAELAELLPFLPSPAFPDLAAVLAELEDARTLVRGPLVAGLDAETVCDADNLETLIRFQRAAARPAFEPRPAAAMTPFLAGWHEFGATRSPERLLEAADRLRGYRAPVPFWLEEAFAPRQQGAAGHALESAAADGLAWRGCSPGSARIGFGEDFDLLGPAEDEEGESVVRLFKDPAARYTFNQLLDESGQDSEAFNAAFWQAVWDGRIAADGFAPLAAGHARRYRLHDAPALGEGRAGSRAARWRARSRARGASLGWPGTWYRVSPATPPSDALERLEETKERCRMLLDRYGILTREHANREGGPLRWAAVFPALRVMELSGEVVAGLFFESFSGPQFALPQALRQLELRAAGEGGTFWINALDPVSPCGLGTALPDVPQRRLTNHLGYCGGRLAVVSENHARRLTILLDPDDADLDALLIHLVPICRARRRLLVEAINDQPVSTSPYLPALSRHLKAVTDHKGVYFEAPA